MKITPTTRTINAETRICASLAYPNRKTTAPVMYNAGFERIGINLKYVAFEPKDIGEAMNAVRALDFVGVSVSKPYKEKVIEHIDEIDEIAKKIGAVNVIHNVNGKLKGYNSDWIGAISSLEEHIDLENKKVAVLGAGGASRAIVYGLTLKKADVYVFNRTEDRGKKLSNEFGVTFGGDFKDVSDINPEIIINATPIGNNEDVSPLPKESYTSTKIVLDINVQKNNSKILSDAESSGVKIINGIRMLVLQGAFTFKLFTGEEAPIDVMQSAVIDALTR